jgi:16S rRNA (uracil1498-N3)-methyltransferase
LTAAHVVVEDVGCDALQLDAADAHHLGAVLRLRPGEEVTATDGAGGSRLYRWEGRGLLSALSAPAFAERPSPPLTVGFAPVKGERPEWAVQKLTELGIDRILLLRTARSVVRWGPAQVERMRRVARQALMQSHGVWLPAVEGPVDFAEAIRLPGAALADPGGGPPHAGCNVVLVGPEGGWAPAELAAEAELGLAGPAGRAGPGLAAGAGLAGLAATAGPAAIPAKVRLAPTVLRTETAAVAAGVILSALRWGIVDGVPPDDQ